MYLLDSDIVSHWQAGHAGIVDRMQRLGTGVVVTSVITRVEVLRARFDFLMKASDGAQLLRAQRLLQDSESLLASLRVVPIDHHAASEFDRLRQHRALRQIGRADLLIASISLATRATLVTRNTRHFALVPRLLYENWID